MENIAKDQRKFSEQVIQRNLQENQEKQKQLNAQVDEYNKLGKSLLEISKKSTNEVLVPLSDVGFFRGKTKHSNEILVFLGGDNYFVERTAHECQSIIDRRKTILQDQLKEVDNQILKFEKMQELLETTTEKSSYWTKEGTIEIREEDEKQVKPINVQEQKILQPVIKEIDEEEDFETQYKKLKLKQKAKDIEEIEALKARLLSQPQLHQVQQKAQQQIPIQDQQIIYSEQPIKSSKDQIIQSQEEQKVQPKSILKKPNQEILEQPILSQIVEKNPYQQQEQSQQDSQTERKKPSRFKQERQKKD